MSDVSNVSGPGSMGEVKEEEKEDVKIQPVEGIKGEKVKFKNIGDMKEKAPELYDKMLKSLASELTNKMRKQQDRLKRIMREGQQG